LISKNVDGASLENDGKLTTIAATINALPADELSAEGLTAILNTPTHPLSSLLNQSLSGTTEGGFLTEKRSPKQG
jgi:hypothetical protein